jgi:hypothetical protein
MIWAFEQKVDVNSDSQFFKFEEIEDLPKKQSNRTHWIEEFNERASRTKYDKEGHEAWQKRKANGLRLFGKYFEALWD